MNLNKETTAILYIYVVYYMYIIILIYVYQCTMLIYYSMQDQKLEKVLKFKFNKI